MSRVCCHQNYTQLNEFKRSQIIGMSEDGFSVRGIPDHMWRTTKTVTILATCSICLKIRYLEEIEDQHFLGWLQRQNNAFNRKTPSYISAFEALIINIVCITLVTSPIFIPSTYNIKVAHWIDTRIGLELLLIVDSCKRGVRVKKGEIYNFLRLVIHEDLSKQNAFFVFIFGNLNTDDFYISNIL